MLDVNDLSPGMFIKLNGEIFQILEASHSHFAQRSGVMQTKLKNVKTGSVTNYSFASRGADKIEEIEIDKKPITFIFGNRGQYTFAFKDGKRFILKEGQLEAQKDFLKPQSELTALIAEGEILKIELPIKMDFKVIEAPPAFKGNTAGAATKMVTIETDTKIQTPIFIKEGDVVRVNTQTREYVERVN